jgi:hypothetical protein
VEELVCPRFVAVVNSYAYLVAFEEVAYHLEVASYPMVEVNCLVAS